MQIKQIEAIRSTKNRIISLVIAVCMLIGLIVVPVESTLAQINDHPDTIAPYISNLEQGLLVLVNRERISRGLLPLSTFPALQQVARQRAAESVEWWENHRRPDGVRSWDTILPEFGITGSGGENLARGSLTTPNLAFELWRNSPGHWAQIINPSYRHLGAGYHPLSFNHRWAQIFLPGNITGIHVHESQRELALPLGATLEEMGVMLVLTCSVHGISFMPVITEMHTAFDNMSQTRQAVTIRYDNFTTTVHITPHPAPSIRQLFPCAGLADAVVNVFRDPSMVNLTGRPNITLDDSLTPQAFRNLMTFEPNHFTPLPITSLEGIQHFPELRALHIWGRVDVQSGTRRFITPEEHPLYDLSPLIGLNNLERVRLEGKTQVTDLNPLAQIPSLRQLTINNSIISDFSPLAVLDDMQLLILNENRYLTDLSFISNYQRLERLEMRHNNINDAVLRSLTGNLPNLTRLDLRNNNITDISPFAGFTNIEWLELDNNQIVDVSPISGMHNLLRLSLDNNEISNVAPLANLRSLTSLNLRRNEILNVTSLLGLTQLESLQLDTQRITLTPILHSNSISIPYPANISPPTSISGNGVYDSVAGIITWNALSVHATQVSFNFSTEITVGNALRSQIPPNPPLLSGSVTQPLLRLDSASEWAHDSIMRAADLGIIPSNLQADYNRPITRSQFASLAVYLYEHVTASTILGRSDFTDTDLVDVRKAAYIGVVTGVGGGRFDPDALLTREQAAVMVARLANVIGNPLVMQLPTFADNDQISTWAFDGVGQMQASGIMGGVGNNRFDPHGAYTREQSVITMLRLFDIVN